MYVFCYIFLCHVLETWCKFFKPIEPTKNCEPGKTLTLKFELPKPLPLLAGAGLNELNDHKMIIAQKFVCDAAKKALFSAHYSLPAIIWQGT